MGRHTISIVRQTADFLRGSVCTRASCNKEDRCAKCRQEERLRDALAGLEAGEDFHPAVALLRKLEWCGVSEEDGFYTADSMPPCCPVCEGLEPGSIRLYGLETEGDTAAGPEGHAKDCELARIIGVKTREEN